MTVTRTSSNKIPNKPEIIPEDDETSTNATTASESESESEYENESEQNFDDNNSDESECESTHSEHLSQHTHTPMLRFTVTNETNDTTYSDCFVIYNKGKYRMFGKGISNDARFQYAYSSIRTARNFIFNFVTSSTLDESYRIYDTMYNLVRINVNESLPKFVTYNLLRDTAEYTASESFCNEGTVSCCINGVVYRNYISSENLYDGNTRDYKYDIEDWLETISDC